MRDLFDSRSEYKLIAVYYLLLGINQLHDVKLLLRETIRSKFKDKEIHPSSWNSMYFPSDRDIRNHMYIANRKLKLDQLDQCNLKKQIDNWKIEDKTRMFYLRTVKEEAVENGDGNKQPKEESELKNVVKQESVNNNENNTFLYVIIIIIFGLTSIFHASMGWTGYING